MLPGAVYGFDWAVLTPAFPDGQHRTNHPGPHPRPRRRASWGWVPPLILGWRPRDPHCSQTWPLIPKARLTGETPVTENPSVGALDRRSPFCPMMGGRSADAVVLVSPPRRPTRHPTPAVLPAPVPVRAALPERLAGLCLPHLLPVSSSLPSTPAPCPHGTWATPPSATASKTTLLSHQRPRLELRATSLPYTALRTIP